MTQMFELAQRLLSTIVSDRNKGSETLFSAWDAGLISNEDLRGRSKIDATRAAEAAVSTVGPAWLKRHHLPPGQPCI